MVKTTAAALESHLEKVRELESRLPFQLAVLSKLLDRQASAYLDGTPLNLTTFRIMSVVDTFGAISISDISAFNAMDRAQVSRSAVDLEALGLVSFGEDARSKRKKLVALTEEGRALWASVQPRFQARARAIEEQLGPELHAALHSGLARIAEMVER